VGPSRARAFVFNRADAHFVASRRGRRPRRFRAQRNQRIERRRIVQFFCEDHDGRVVRPREAEKARQQRHRYPCGVLWGGDEVDDDEAETSGAQEMIGRAGRRARITRANNGQRREIDPAVPDIRREKRTARQPHPRRAIAGELRFEDEPERRRERRRVGAPGELDEASGQFANRPPRRVRGKRDLLIDAPRSRKAEKSGRTHPPIQGEYKAKVNSQVARFYVLHYFTWTLGILR